MIADMMADYGGRLLVAIAGVGLGLFALVTVLKYMRQRNGTISAPTFSLGGKSRTTHRLQVLETAVIDTRRRLVLIRRDDVEHLILIGGPADLVIEGEIGAIRMPLVAPVAREPREAPAELRMPEPEYPPAYVARAAAAAVEPAPRVPAAEPVPQPVEFSAPITPHAAYFESSDDDFEPEDEEMLPEDVPPRPPGYEKSQALREAEAHLEAMKRRMNEQNPRAAAASAPEPVFGKVLNDEMKSPLRESERAVPPAIQKMGQRPAAAPQRPVAAPKNANIQDEIARIFGDKK